MSAIEQAKAYALQKTGLKWDRLDKWSDADRQAYLAANAEFRRNNAGLFTLAEQAAGDNLPPRPSFHPEDFSYVGAFGDALGERVEELGAKVGGVGEGIFSTLSLSRWLIPGAAIVAVIILLRALSVRTGASKS